MRKDIARFLVEFEKRSKERGNTLYLIYFKLNGRKKESAAKIIDMVETGKITYEEGVRRLRELARG